MMIIADNEDLQKLMVKQGGLELLRTILQQPLELNQPYPTASSLEEGGRIHEVRSSPCPLPSH